MVVLYQEGIPHKDGRIIVKEINLINNVKSSYYFGVVLSVIIFFPNLLVLIDFLDFFLIMNMRRIINMIVQITRNMNKNGKITLIKDIQN